MAVVLQSMPAIRAKLDALNDQLADLHRRLAKIEARREARKRGEKLDEWVPVIAV